MKRLLKHKWQDKVCVRCGTVWTRKTAHQECKASA